MAIPEHSETERGVALQRIFDACQESIDANLLISF